MAAPAAPTYLGEVVCRACHNAEGLHWDGTIHSEIFRKRPRNDLERKGCEACHGPGSEHLKNPKQPGTIIGFTHASGTPIETQNETCLQCHAGGERIYWRGSIHDMESVSCADCHDPMTRLSPASLLRTSSVNDTCFTCHPKQRHEFRKRSHMPLLEGKISCVDCHNPHGGPTDPLLRTDSVNQLCFQCHGEKRGPFLWEHAPVSENCLNCHSPHGSNRERLLTVSLPSLCQQCHMGSSIWNHASRAMTPADLRSGDERIVNRACLNCHSRIHGSNHPSGARFHR
ncbi:MAG: DmsE family decaheme c-type cytochrome [Deltaproteobacteria bacterium]|nr:DmsE family decaheme c-type cytochrome [Deltaproteobacteria bacterium]MBW2388199.1 DmsE family decaheme c-type cytochrome [Deltaproteobacteria bacterium]MBW2725462.1 DmsE family decaheme c-type cytochrome [Deltaproteobacteria bacterium]